MRVGYTYKVLSAGFALLLLASAGCTTQRISADKTIPEALAIAHINTLLNRSRDRISWSDDLANLTGFVEYATDARGTRRDYSEIQTVEFQANYFGVIMLGIVDPTVKSCVLLKYKDTRSVMIERVPFTTIWAWFPFYIFKPTWTEAKMAALGFERMRDGINGMDH